MHLYPDLGRMKHNLHRNKVIIKKEFHFNYSCSALKPNPVTLNVKHIR